MINKGSENFKLLYPIRMKSKVDEIFHLLYEKQIKQDVCEPMVTSDSPTLMWIYKTRGQFALIVNWVAYNPYTNLSRSLTYIHLTGFHSGVEKL